MFFKKGEVIFFASAESAPMVEHVCEVENFDSVNNEIETTKVITIIKDGGGFHIVKGMGLVSTFNKLKDENCGVVHINMSNFDLCGIVEDTEVIEALNKSKSKLVLDNSKEKEVKNILLGGK